mmetsp:Transcript_33250/g.46407  ORF Transcript_33250/g.46407 Transcript_33250/m.46407 type:complete len:105 (-) Transcript_33250:203-517(-)
MVTTVKNLVTITTNNKNNTAVVIVSISKNIRALPLHPHMFTTTRILLHRRTESAGMLGTQENLRGVMKHHHSHRMQIPMSEMLMMQLCLLELTSLPELYRMHRT